LADEGGENPVTLTFLLIYCLFSFGSCMPSKLWQSPHFYLQVECANQPQLYEQTFDMSSIVLMNRQTKPLSAKGYAAIVDVCEFQPVITVGKVERCISR
jgi:hypothetical protein